MRKILFILTIALLGNLAYSSAQELTHLNGISLSGIFVDYTSPHIGGSPFKEVKVYDFENLGIGGEVKYTRLLNQFFAVGVPFRLAQVQLPATDTSFTEKELAMSLDGQIQLGYFPTEARLKPYLYAGMGVNMDGPDNDINLQMPLGIACNIRIFNQVHLQVQTEYRTSFGVNRNNWLHSAGLLYMFGGGSKDKNKADKNAVDTDNDGVPDKDDSCPDSPGVAAFSGCPDTDNDGIGDFEDDCPTLAGLLEFNGCPDMDSDGVSDREDDCPDAAGLPELRGCPDGDNDGVSDPMDSCPEQPGPADNNGCPTEVNDRDDDGVVDGEDACPDQQGLARFNGCPDMDADGVPDKDDPCPRAAGSLNGCPDTDGDGVADDADRCPSIPGVLSQNGCPEQQTSSTSVITVEDKEILDRAMYAVKFETGNARLRGESNSVLEQIADVMNRYPGYFLKISGHTDSIGSSSDNQKLSEKRAKACYDYLVSKGISTSRMEYKGHGEKQPIATNKYKDGREKNRRVMFELIPR